MLFEKFQTFCHIGWCRGTGLQRKSCINCQQRGNSPEATRTGWSSCRIWMRLLGPERQSFEISLHRRHQYNGLWRAFSPYLPSKGMCPAPTEHSEATSVLAKLHEREVCRVRFFEYVVLQYLKCATFND